MFDSQGNFLFHSQDWRNHKYIRKEGNRYIYPEDIKTPQQASRNTGGTGGTHSGYGSGGSHVDRKVVAPSAPNPSRAGMPSNVGNRKNTVRGGQADPNTLYQTYASRKSTRTKDGRTIQSMDRTSQGGVGTAQTEMKKGLAANERKKHATSNSGIAVSEKKKGETAAKNRVNKLRPGQVSSDTRNTLHKTANRNYEIDYGNGHTRGRGTDNYDDERGRGQAYTAREEMKKGTDIVKKKEEADQKRYDEAFKNVDNVLAKLTGKSRKYEADIAEAKAKKLAKQRKEDEEYLRTLPEDFEISRAAEKSRIEKNKTEEEKWKVAKDISEARYKDTLHYKATKAAENMKNAAKKTAKAYDEMHEKQADALIKGKEKVKSLLKKKKKK